MSRKSLLIAAGALVVVGGAVTAIAQIGPEGGRDRGRMMGDKGERGDRMGRGSMRGEGGDRTDRGWRGRGERNLTQDEYDARTRERFARLDKNGDNVIDASELEAAINERAAQRGNRGQRFAQRMLTRVDENRDGKVSKDEFLNEVRKRFARLDLNNDGRITDEDLPPMMRGRDVLKSDSGGGPGLRAGRGGRGGGAGMLNRLRQADANKDGVITLDEALAQATKRFELADRNKDGVLDQTDFDAMRKEMADYRVQRFVHRYGADKDGKVTREQFYKAAKDRFARLDVNTDGRLDREDMGGRGGRGRR